jgi:UDP-glucose 4-epimerase
MRVLVPGGAGFIGSHLVDRLVADGHQVLVTDDLSTGHRANLAAAEQTGQCRFVETDVAGPELVPLVVDFAPELVLHLAAQMDVRKSVADPLYDARTNVLGTVNVLSASVQCRARKFVFASSGGTIYGEPDRLPVTEDAPLRPSSPYGAAKVAGETYVAAFARLHGFAWTSLALGNVYGPRQDPHGEAGVVAIFGRAMLAGQPTMVFGDGSTTRDYIHVDDVVSAVLACFDERTDGARFNVGTGRSTSIRELHRLMADMCDATDTPQFHPERLGELRHIALDSSALTTATGWSPRVSFDVGLAGVVEWIASTRLDSASA